ncbi:MAG TPA: hypothetical protein VGR80_06825 [Steroidobacteraceae bacterium]|nr:hypothetical protein [Gammaproteobacteria bacterium]HEV2285737.1 hypothetical protein [Steroidobacteraceae bacterium]
MAAANDLPEVELDAKNLYREDVFTDRRAGSIRRLTPVASDGSADGTRAVLFSGQTQLLTPAGVLPLGFEIEAATLEEALRKFPEGVKLALEQAIDEARELRREAASRIVVPEVGGALGAGPAPGPGGGKIKFP